MISNTSLFNFGIFKTNLKRFKWGSFLYFIILFFSTPFSFVMQDFQRLVQRQINNGSLLLNGEPIIFPVLFAFVVPTIVAALIFNNVHSQKQGIFIHGLPVKRSANFISDVLSGIVLMALPIILNTVILLFMSLGKFDIIFSTQSVFLWMFIQLGIVFIMFSVATFSAFLTGNTATHIGINIFLHVLPMLVALAISVISNVFLFGFTSSHDFIADKILSNSPVVWLFTQLLEGRENINIYLKLNMWLYLIFATIMYILSFILYKIRKIEANGDVAAFKVFRPIFKYSVTAASAILAFAATYYNFDAIYIYITVFVATFVVYFASQMLLNKSFKVFKFYKGYIAFLLCCALFISFFAFTSVFGYETRVPEKDNIIGAAVHNVYNVPLFTVDDEKVIDATLQIHKDLIKHIPVTEDRDFYDGRRVTISYLLKDKGVLERQYLLSQEEYERAMSLMYESEKYKLMVTEISDLNIENINYVDIQLNSSGFDFNHYENDMAFEIISAVKKDVEALSYQEITKNEWLNFRISVSCTARENQTLNLFKTKLTGENDEYMMQNFSIPINSNFKNTWKVLEDTGYVKKLKEKIGSSMYIYKEWVSFSPESDNQYIPEKSYAYSEYVLDKSKFAQVEFSHALKVLDLMLTSEAETQKGESCYIYLSNDFDNRDYHSSGATMIIPKDDLPDFLKAYMN